MQRRVTIIGGRSDRFRRAFTLVELLAVIAIVGVLIVILLPSARRSMAHASSTLCLNHLRELDRALQQYRMDNRGFLPDVAEPSPDGDIDPQAAAWYSRLSPVYLQNPMVQICPSDPARNALNPTEPYDRHPNAANASSYGMNGLIRAGNLWNLDRRGPKSPLQTILLADMGPDVFDGRRVDRNDGWLPWDDGYHPATAGLTKSWLTGRHFGHINVLTVGGAVKSVRTAELMEERIRSYYGSCASGGCPLCLQFEVAHYSFAPARVFWWTGTLNSSE